MSESQKLCVNDFKGLTNDSILRINSHLRTGAVVESVSVPAVAADHRTGQIPADPELPFGRWVLVCDGIAFP